MAGAACASSPSQGGAAAPSGPWRAAPPEAGSHGPRSNRAGRAEQWRWAGGGGATYGRGSDDAGRAEKSGAKPTADRVSLLLPLHLGEMRSDFDNCLKVFGIEEVIGNLLELSLISKICQMVVFLVLGINMSNLLEMLLLPSDASGSQR